jgi:hypothetical protein
VILTIGGRFLSRTTCVNFATLSVSLRTSAPASYESKRRANESVAGSPLSNCGRETLKPGILSGFQVTFFVSVY